MGPTKLPSQWAVENPTIARARLLTAVRYLSEATINVGRMMGTLDVAHMGSGTASAAQLHIELGMDEVHRALLHTVHALDMGREEQGSIPWPPEISHQATRDQLTQACERLRSGRLFVPGSLDARKLAGAIETLMDLTVIGKKTPRG